MTLIARGAHLAALRADGLRIESPKGDLHLPDIKATDDPAGVGPVDVVMFMVKNCSMKSLAYLENLWRGSHLLRVKVKYLFQLNGRPTETGAFLRDSVESIQRH